MRSGNVTEKYHLQPRGLRSHLFSILTLSSDPNSNVSPALTVKVSGLGELLSHCQRRPHCSEQKVCLFGQTPLVK